MFGMFLLVGRICDHLLASIAVFSTNWKPRVLKCHWVNSIGSWWDHTDQNKDRYSDTERTFYNRTTGCNIVFQRNKYYV